MSHLSPTACCALSAVLALAGAAVLAAGARIPGAVLMFAAAAASLAGIVAAIRHHRAWQARMRQYGALRAHR